MVQYIQNLGRSEEPSQQFLPVDILYMVLDVQNLKIIIVFCESVLFSLHFITEMNFIEMFPGNGREPKRVLFSNVV